jgi:hypothetical protein
VAGSPFTVGKGAQTRLITGLANGTVYTFTIRAVDASGNKSVEKSAAATPVGSDFGDPDPELPGTIYTVTVSPATVSLAKGATQAFTATVQGTNSPAQTVTWTMSGGGSGTAISTGGILSVAANETAQP